MLAEHLSQEHDLASRRGETIDRHVEWIFREVLGSRASRVLDLGCGPGFYMSRLARRGCECVGVDFSPASIRHATKTAADEGLACTYLHADVRQGDFGDGFDLVMMIYGQINVFPRDRGLEILQRAREALAPGGRLLLEVQGFEAIEQRGKAGPSWYSTDSGLFSAQPHIVLQENFWNPELQASTARFSVIDAQTGSVATYALSNEAYSRDDLAVALRSVGFDDHTWHSSLTGEPTDGEDLPVVVATTTGPERTP
jgi:SAM-dependent methyltransferase